MTADLSRPVPLRLLVPYCIGDSIAVDISIQRHSNGYLMWVLQVVGSRATMLAHDTVLAQPSVPPIVSAECDREDDIMANVESNSALCVGKLEVVEFASSSVGESRLLSAGVRISRL